MRAALRGARAIGNIEVPGDVSSSSATKTLSRARLLRSVGGALVGSSILTLTRQAPAEGSHCGPTPGGCYGYTACCNCSDPGSPRADLGCPSGTGCWYYVDSGSCRTYRCCDYYQGHPCICRYYVGPYC